MTTNQMSICPTCDGSKVVTGFINRGDQGCSVSDMRCYRCKGEGVVPDDVIEWIDEGKKLRAYRIQNDRSIWEESKRLNMRPSVLSDMEHGKICPYTLDD